MGTDKSPDPFSSPFSMETNRTFRYGIPTPPANLSSASREGEDTDMNALGPKFGNSANLRGAPASGVATGSIANANVLGSDTPVHSHQSHSNADDIGCQHPDVAPNVAPNVDFSANPVGESMPNTSPLFNTGTGSIESKVPDPSSEFTDASLRGAQRSDTATATTTINESDTPVESLITFTNTYITQSLVLSCPMVRRFQMDLQILMSFPDNSTLQWRPTWFSRRKKHCKPRYWTLYNPPNVVTEYLPLPSTRDRKTGNVIPGKTSVICTRRIRLPGDPEPQYIKTWAHWRRYCNLYGIPEGWLSAELIAFARMGMPKDPLTKSLVTPSTYPLYPEPQPRGQGRYILSPPCHRNLPEKFHHVDVEGKRGEKEVLVVHSTGKLQVATWSEYYFHASQWTESTGRGEFRDWKGYSADFDAEIRTQGLSRRWCWLPWTDEMEQSCGEEAAADWAAYQPVDGNTRITLWLAKQNKEEVTSPPHAASASTDSRLSLGLSPTPAAGRGKKRKRN